MSMTLDDVGLEKNAVQMNLGEDDFHEFVASMPDGLKPYAIIAFSVGWNCGVDKCKPKIIPLLDKINELEVELNDARSGRLPT